MPLRPVAIGLNSHTCRFDLVKGNRIKHWRDQEYAYDAWGNLIEKQVELGTLQTFSHDCENRLVRADTLTNGRLEGIGTYRYDSLGRRIGKTSEINGQTDHKHFLWQGLRMLRGETRGRAACMSTSRIARRPLREWTKTKASPNRALLLPHRPDRHAAGDD